MYQFFFANHFTLSCRHQNQEHPRNLTFLPCDCISVNIAHIHIFPLSSRIQLNPPTVCMSPQSLRVSQPLLLSFMTSPFLETDQLSCRMSHNLDSSDHFLMIRFQLSHADLFYLFKICKYKQRTIVVFLQVFFL